MPLEIRMPQIASDMTEADVVSWLAAVGDRVEQGEIVLEIETEKSTVEIEAPASGVLLEIRIPAGTAGVAVGTVLAVLDAEAGAEVSDASTAAGAPPRDEAEPATPGSAAAIDEAAHEAPGGRGATALARRVAEQAGIDLARVEGTGPRGRITRRDVEERLTGRPAATGAAGAPTSTGAPRATGTRAALRLSARCRVDDLVSVRERLNGSGLTEPVTLADLVLRALAGALAEVPEASGTGGGEEGIGLAIGVPDAAQSLVAPVIARADGKGLAALASEARSLSRRALAGELTPEDFDPQCFAVVDLGLEGVDEVEAPLDTSHTGVLTLGAPRSEPVVEAGAVRTGTAMTLALAVDPERVPETVAARLLAALRRRVERPLEMVA